MPVTRANSEKIRTKHAMGENAPVKIAGERVACSVVGSEVDLGSCGGSKSSVRSSVKLAKFRAEQLSKEFELEQAALELSQKRRMLQAENEVQLAKMSVNSDEEKLSTIFEKFPVKNTNPDDYVEQWRRSNENEYPGLLKHPDSKNIKPVPSVNGLTELPKVQLIPFDGNVRSYWRFVRQFETYVEAKTNDEGQRYLYLLHYCHGCAREAIEECVMLPTEQAYREARRILCDLFGQPHVVSRALVDELIERFQTANDSRNLSRLAVKMRNCEIALSQMGMDSDLNALSLIERLVSCLPVFMQRKWAECADEWHKLGRNPRFEDLTEFVSTRARIESSRFGMLTSNARQSITSSSQLPTNKGRPKSEHKVYAHLDNPTQIPLNNTRSCAICTEKHDTQQCDIFLNMPIEKRWDEAKLKFLCFKCLRRGHGAALCNAITVCGVNGCKARHHKLLHSDSRDVPPTVRQVACGVGHSSTQFVSLGLLPVRVIGPKGTRDMYAFLDSGSDSTIISKEVVDDLGIELNSTTAELTTLGGKVTTCEKASIFEIASMDGEYSVAVESALVVDRLMPNTVIRPRLQAAEAWSHLRDVEFDEVDCKKVAILIGCDVPEVHWVIEQRIGGRKQPYAVKTILGWLLFGPINPNVNRYSVNFISTEKSNIDHLLRRLYDSEFHDANSIEKAPSREDMDVVKLVSRETLLVEGHFQVPLPWKDKLQVSYDNRPLAVARLNALRRKFLKEPNLFEKYSDVIKSNFDKGYAKISQTHLNNGVAPLWYLPHHAVINPKKPEKVRVVFDCAAKWRNISLNDMLNQGPDITSNLVDVLLRFRIGRYAMSADIEEMFMQVRVPEQDRCALRFLWWVTGDLNSERWLLGPQNLCGLTENVNLELESFPAGVIELKSVYAVTNTEQRANPLKPLIDYYSKWVTLVKCFAWLIRFVKYLKSKSCGNHVATAGYLTLFDFRDAQRNIIQIVQHDVFSNEVALLNKGEGLKGSYLAKLNPILIDGLLRVGGRLSSSNYPSTTKHPIVLPSKHTVTNLLVEYYHELEGHCGFMHVLSVIRRQFWIVRGPSVVKRVIGHCFKCRRKAAQSCAQMMAHLPLSRIEKGRRCFESVGIDYFGPFLVKRGRSMEKRFGCVFTCLRMRAVHIEVAHSLSTDSFILILMRFIARRGKPTEIYSDNGTNFVGAVRELKDHIERWDQHKINNHLIERDTQWYFHPPDCSHRGGVWERIIRSIRAIMKGIVDEQVLNDESLLTFFAEVERILNNRPLVPPSSDSRDSDPLTPNHLLLMDSNTGIPTDCNMLERYTRRWKQVNYLCDIFWTWWLREYLPTLQMRQKWKTSCRNLREGDLVIVTSEHVARDKWPLGVVIGSKPDSDGLVRAVTIRTHSGTITRDVRKVCLLEGARVHEDQKDAATADIGPDRAS